MSLPNTPLLIVEDDLATLNALETLATRSGFDTVPCHTVDMALEKMGNSSPAALIIDWELGPQGDGVDVARAAMDCLPQPVIVMITGADITKLQQRTRDLPILEYLSKPFKGRELTELLQRVQNHLPSTSPPH